MNIETLHIGMKVRHPQYGVGMVRSLTEQTAEIAFDDARRTIAPASSNLQPAEASATLSELEIRLANLIRDTAHAVVEALGLEQKDVLVEGLATRWQRRTLVMQPADSSLQPKEVYPSWSPRRPWRARDILPQNRHDSEYEPFQVSEIGNRQSEILRILFKNKDDQFRTGAQGSAVGRPNA